MNLNVLSRLIKEVSPNILWKLLRNMCINSAMNLYKFNRRIKNNENFFPAFVFISLTNKCDLYCKGCWVTKTNPAKELSLEQVDNVISTSKKYGSKFFGLLGGEPLMYKDLLKIIKKHSDCYFQLFTNGSFLTLDIAEKMKKLGNVTPLISIEGFEKESNERRSKYKSVFNNAVKAVNNCSEKKLFTGVASSICKTNFKELVSEKYLSFLIKNKVQYLWYYIYRPVGDNPSPELALAENEILELRKFIVDMRVKVPLIIVDAYWDAEGDALCPGAVGLSHHINPNGAIEFCPPFQFACDFLNEKGTNLEMIFNNSKFLTDLRIFVSQETRGCILMEKPDKLYDFLKIYDAEDSSNRNLAYNELKKMKSHCSHEIIGGKIPEKSYIYKMLKKRYFFGFGAYG